MNAKELTAAFTALQAENVALRARVDALEARPAQPARTQQPARLAQRPHVPCDVKLRRSPPIFAKAACLKLSAHVGHKCWVQVLGDDCFQVTKGLDEPSAKVDGYGLIALVNAELAKPKAKTLEETLETPPWAEAA